MGSDNAEVVSKPLLHSSLRTRLDKVKQMIRANWAAAVAYHGLRLWTSGREPRWTGTGHSRLFHRVGTRRVRPRDHGRSRSPICALF